MATIEKTGIMTYVDDAGNEIILYPVTTPDAVYGLIELLAGAVNKNGDTMAGMLNVPDLSVFGDGYKAVSFLSADKKGRAEMQVSSNNRFVLNQRETGSAYADRYMLPAVTAGLTGDKWYSILTTKNVEEGRSALRVGMAVTTLWTNASPTSSFAAQNICSVSGYDLVLVVTKLATSKDLRDNVLIRTGDGNGGVSNFPSKSADGASDARYRWFKTASDGKLSCGGGYAAGTADNAACIPVAVYGLKW